MHLFIRKGHLKPLPSDRNAVGSSVTEFTSRWAGVIHRSLSQGPRVFHKHRKLRGELTLIMEAINKNSLEMP